MIRWLFIGLAVAIAGALVSISGVVPLAASSGHWSITEDILRFSMQRSVATWSMAVEVPPLDAPARIVQGAGHYDRGCRSCHGAPGEPPPPEALAMLPPPPDLATVKDRDPEDVFYTVLHGVKFTGMPAWPVLDREDEVWAMVSFLRRLPTLDADTYRTLVREASPLPVPDGVRACTGCHGADGLGRGANPRLAGQSEAYLQAALRAYASGERSSGTMQVALHGHDEDDFLAAARWYAAQPPGPPTPPPPGADPARGEAIARGRVARVPGCVACHGPGDAPRNPLYPSLVGQDPYWIALETRRFRDHTHGGSPFARVMEATAAHALLDTDIAHVSAWYGSLGASE